MSYIGFSAILLFVLTCLNQAAAASDHEIYYIATANSLDRCTDSVQTCLTLSQIAANLSRLLHRNTTLVFLPGTHYLSSIDLTFSDFDNFVMKSENSIAAQIKCTSYSRIHFHQSQSIHISNLEFIGCRRSLVSLIKQLLIADTKFEGQENGGTALEMVETAAQIVNSTFVSNRIGSSTGRK